MILTKQSPPSRAVESPGDQTRLALIRAAIRLFGEKGYEATSTRELAAAAQVNIASIAYHFGGKEGLRQACATLIGARLKQAVEADFFAPDDDLDPARAQAKIEAAFNLVLEFLLGRPEARENARFILSELVRPGEVVDRMYSDFIFPMHSRLCVLLGQATGQDPESDLIRIGAFSIVGQVVYFRIGSPFIVRRMGWEAVGPDEIEQVKTVILGNIRAFIASNRKQPA